MIAVVTGMIASYPVGGVVWDYGQYALGLERLGFEVYYLEDTGWQTYNPMTGYYGDDASYAVRFLEDSLGELSPSLRHRWHFRNMTGDTHGIDSATFHDIVGSADLFLNVSGGTLLRDEYMPCRRKVLIDTDPGWNHFRNYPKWDANPNWYGSHGYRAHNHFFTYAECLGRAGCVLPDMGLNWHPTRPPVVLDQWQPEAPGKRWTTVMTWKNFQEPIVYDGVTYGTKEMEFGRVEQLPHRCPASFEVAVGGAAAPISRLQEFGWSVIDSHDVSKTAGEYRHYIQQSRGEFSVAKNVYVATHSGWFSCRSTCYLAAGRPAVLQDTGFSEVLPVGDGVLVFSNAKEAVAAVDEVERHYEHHQQAAREFAKAHLDANVVLGDMLNRLGI